VRELASDYDVAHTTLVRYFARPEVVKKLKEAATQLRAEERALAARRTADRRLEREVRKKAKQQAATEREQERHSQAAVAGITARRRPARTSYEAWLDERDARRPLTRAELWSTADEIAAGVVADGGGIQAVIDATGFHTIENVVRGIDPAIVTQAYDNDLLAQMQPPLRS
jgi:hypothetical protein